MARKSIEEMVKQFTPEEWRKKIEEGMKELGLYFGNTQEEYRHLSFEEYDTEIHTTRISFYGSIYSNERYSDQQYKKDESFDTMISVDYDKIGFSVGNVIAA